MCREIQSNIDIDTVNKVTCKWGEEGHLNRYLLTNPPQKILSQSYLFSERCLDVTCSEPICRLLRESSLPPLMGIVA